MELAEVIGLLSSIVTLEEAGRSWVFIVKDKLKRKKIDINDWDSDNSLVQLCLDKFKTGIGDKYKDHIFQRKKSRKLFRAFLRRIGYWGLESRKRSKSMRLLRKFYMHIMSIRNPLCRTVKEHYIICYHQILI